MIPPFSAQLAWPGWLPVDWRRLDGGSPDKMITAIPASAFKTQQTRLPQTSDIAAGSLRADLPLDHDISGPAARSLADSVKKPALPLIQSRGSRAIYGVIIRVIYRVISSRMGAHRGTVHPVGRQ